MRLILDSGASAHIFNDLKFFDKIEMGKLDMSKTGKQRATLPIAGQGSVKISWGEKKKLSQELPVRSNFCDQSHQCWRTQFKELQHWSRMPKLLFFEGQKNGL